MRIKVDFVDAVCMILIKNMSFSGPLLVLLLFSIFSNDWKYNDDSSSESESEKERPPPSKRVGARKPIPKRNIAKQRFSSDESSVDSDDDKRRSFSKRTLASVSYKEASEEEKTEEEDLLDVDLQETAEAAVQEEKVETIEKITAQRRGKKGGVFCVAFNVSFLRHLFVLVTGNITTLYAVEENGDPNADTDVTDMDNTELQYLIKWKDWAHIHNTWESENTLKEQKVKGIKKLENFIKKEADLEFWRRHASPEDIEYYECQMELHQELFKSYTNVERIIGTVFLSV